MGSVKVGAAYTLTRTDMEREESTLLKKATELLGLIPDDTRDAITGTEWDTAAAVITNCKNAGLALLDCCSELDKVTHRVVTVLAGGGLSSVTRRALADFAEVVTRLKRDTFDRAAETL